MPRYNPAEIEPRWQAYWEQHRTFATPDLPSGKKRYILDMFPYPSGDGLHVGHPEGYTATDIVSRFARIRGESVLHPMGFDAFGLPAEEHAIKTGEHPRIQTQKNIDNFHSPVEDAGFQLRLGSSVRHDRRKLFSLDAVDLFAVFTIPGSTRAAERRPIRSCRFRIALRRGVRGGRDVPGRASVGLPGSALSIGAPLARCWRTKRY